MLKIWWDLLVMARCGNKKIYHLTVLILVLSSVPLSWQQLDDMKVHKNDAIYMKKHSVLRTYIKFKANFSVEAYLNLVTIPKRRTISLLRVSSHTLAMKLVVMISYRYQQHLDITFCFVLVWTLSRNSTLSLIWMFCDGLSAVASVHYKYHNIIFWRHLMSVICTPENSYLQSGE